MAGLRKALGDGKDGARYITTLAGRGYCFVAPVSRAGARAMRRRPPMRRSSRPRIFRTPTLPNRLSRMVGRDDDILKGCRRSSIASRFVTIVGAGGVGKTTVAVAIGHHLTEAFHGAVLFVDLGMLSDPEARDHGRGLHARALGAVRRCAAEPDGASCTTSGCC